jgi:hypothetical protein
VQEAIVIAGNFRSIANLIDQRLNGFTWRIPQAILLDWIAMY